MFAQNLDFKTKFVCLPKIWILKQNLYVCPKFGFLTKIWIFKTKFVGLPKIWIFDQNFGFSEDCKIG